jgi:hypothetical protein
LIGIIKKGDNAITLTLRVTPRSSRTGFSGKKDQGIKLQVKSPPVEGAANTECINFLARIFHLPKTAIRIVRGHKSRVKVVDIDGISLEQATSILEPLLK